MTLMAPDLTFGAIRSFFLWAAPHRFQEDNSGASLVHRAGLDRVGVPGSLISIRIGISVALVEIFLGFVAGNCGAHFGFAIFQPNAWINFLAGFGSVVLTFLAGAEI
jgi:Kef-type K+ transport system membrane component KefB